jgi:hypothetical protein
MFLAPSDFTGKYELHTGMYDNAKLQMYIDKYEQRYLRELLGIELYTEFISDLAIGVPKSPNFLTIFNPLFEDVNQLSMIESDGIIEMLKGFIYFEYSKDQMMQQTTFGGVQQKSENSKVLTSLQSMIYARYNEAIRTYKAIQDYILLNTQIPIGQAVDISVNSGGTGYTNALGVATIGGSGTGCTVNIVVVTGVVNEATIANGGSNYLIGDTFAIAGGTTNAILNVSYVGKGIFGNFKGKRKSTAYWI